MEILLLHSPEANVIARGSYLGGPDYEFIIWVDGQVYFQVVDDDDRVWAGPDGATFRRIATVWNRCGIEVARLEDYSDQMEVIWQMREEMAPLGAFPGDLPPGTESLWSLLVTEAELGIG